MHSLTTVVIVLAATACCQFGVEGKSCTNVCPAQERPVCATIYRKNGAGFISCTFGNLCKLNARECMTGEKWLNRPGRCDRDIPGCAAMTAGPAVKETGAPPKIETTTEKTFGQKFKDLFGRKKTN